MTLLATIAAAAAAADAGNLTPSPKYPFVLNAGEVFRKLSHETDSPPSSSLVRGVSGWSLSHTDTDLADFSSQLCQTLRKRLKNPKSLGREEFLDPLGSFFTKVAERIRLYIGVDPSDPGFIPKGIEKLGFLIGKEAVGLIIEGCVLLEIWEIIEILISQYLVGNLNSVNLIEKLAEKNQSELLCLSAREISHLKSSELVLILKYFLSPSVDSLNSMVSVRKKWESECLLAIEKATQKGLDEKASILAKEVSILLMMAHDGFSSSEICLHYVFGSSNLDKLVLSSAMSRLDGSEVLGLVRYFVKWLEKYQRFPEAGACPLARSVLGLSLCESVPSLEGSVAGLGLVLDEHFSYLVLNLEFHEEMKALENVVKALASEAEMCMPVNEIVKHLQSLSEPAMRRAMCT